MTAVTIIACGTPESAPSWWTPDSDIGPMEAAWIESMMAEQEEAWRELEAGEDRAHRLLDGPCDGCQEPCILPLIELGGEALCPACLEASGIDYNEAVELTRAPGSREAGPP
jgi:formylmethanofuran dehydrogenase subunit E